jgi:hypothetical protein
MANEQSSSKHTHTEEVKVHGVRELLAATRIILRYRKAVMSAARETQRSQRGTFGRAPGGSLLTGVAVPGLAGMAEEPARRTPLEMQGLKAKALRQVALAEMAAARAASQAAAKQAAANAKLAASKERVAQKTLRQNQTMQRLVNTLQRTTVNSGAYLSALRRLRNMNAVMAASYLRQSRIVAGLNRAYLFFNNTLGKGVFWTKQLFVQMRSLITSAMVFVGVIMGAAFGLKTFYDAALEAQSAMAGLRAVAQSTGRNMSEIQGVLNRIVASGLMPMAEASAALKNLLQVQNLTVEQAETALWRFLAAAMANRKSTQSMGQQVVLTTQGLRDQLSVLTDSVGIAKNLPIIIKEWAEANGRLVSSLSHEEKQLISVIGLMKEAEKFMPLLNDASLENVRTAARLSAAWNKMKITLGTVLMPVLIELVQHLTAVANRLSGMADSSQDATRRGLRPFIDAAKQMVNLMVAAIFVLVEYIPWLGKLIIKYGQLLLWTVLIGKALALLVGVLKVLRESATITAAIVSLLTGNLVGLAVSIAALGLGIAAFAKLSKEAKKLGDELDSLKAKADRMGAGGGQFGFQTAPGMAPANPTFAVTNQFNNEVNINDQQIVQGMDELKSRVLAQIRSGNASMEDKMRDIQAALRV